MTFVFTLRRKVDHFRDPCPGTPLFPPGSAQANSWAEAGDDFAQRLEKKRQPDLGLRRGDIGWRILQRMVLDPVGCATGLRLLGAYIVAAQFVSGAVRWWPGEEEPVVLLGTDYGPLMLGLHTGWSLDAAGRWASDPLTRICWQRGCRRHQAARSVARAFGLGELPRVRA